MSVLTGMRCIPKEKSAGALPLERKKEGAWQRPPSSRTLKSAIPPVPILSGTSHIPAGRSLQKAWPLNRPSEAAVRGFVRMNQPVLCESNLICTAPLSADQQQQAEAGHQASEQEDQLRAGTAR